MVYKCIVIHADGIGIRRCDISMVDRIVVDIWRSIGTGLTYTDSVESSTEQVLEMFYCGN